MEKLINPEPNQSIFCHWEPRAKIIAFSLLLLSFTMVKSLALVMAMLLTSSIIFGYFFNLYPAYLLNACCIDGRSRRFQYC
jgi:hypothetical protein